MGTSFLLCTTAPSTTLGPAVQVACNEPGERNRSEVGPERWSERAETLEHRASWGCARLQQVLHPCDVGCRFFGHSRGLEHGGDEPEALHELGAGLELLRGGEALVIEPLDGQEGEREGRELRDMPGKSRSSGGDGAATKRACRRVTELVREGFRDRSLLRGGDVVANPLLVELGELLALGSLLGCLEKLLGQLPHLPVGLARTPAERGP